jgi:23S rRNA (cytidine1920-2'-O)/16S rRNA (cytidine1409-2'-O)-methyltransferase
MMRADLYLYNFGYVKSRQKAKTLIEEGYVKINGVIVKKPSLDIDESAENLVDITDICPYVSRGGLKLEKIINELNLDINSKVAIDIGASTGGFTHCLLLNGASKVYAIDSGTSQLDESLAVDDRVVSIEGYNARYLKLDDIGQLVDLITIDVSFISQTLIIPTITCLLKENGIYISLIKPQFEVGKGKIGKGGIVKEKKYRYEAVSGVIDCACKHGLNCYALFESPIQGGDGNIEYIAAFSKNEKGLPLAKIKNLFNSKRG